MTSEQDNKEAWRLGEFLITVVLSVFIGWLIGHSSSPKGFIIDNNSISMIKNQTQAFGFYDYDGFFCSWTKDRNETDIVDTNYEEIAHAMVAEDYRHFCEDNNMTKIIAGEMQ